MGSLFDEVRGEANIFSAWRHVKRSALNSDNSEIRGFAAEFEHQHQRHLRRIITQLREDRFEFDPAKGVLKDKKKRLASGKDPRPIAIATLKNRVVQRAILQVLQPRKARNPKDIDTRYEVLDDPRLGRINQVNRSKFGVGGLIYPYGGVRPAVNLVLNAMENGARYYYQSDIKSFFTRIPTKDVVEWVEKETGDGRLSGLFAKGLDIHLSNEDELAGYSKLFPSGGIGVAQGSSLSAFAGNVLLFEFDHELNSSGVSAVRYIDDVLILAKSEADLDKAIELSGKRLGDFGFDLYKPAPGSTKAARGLCADGINFLGCAMQPKRCVPSGPSMKRIKDDVASTLSASKAAIIDAVRASKIVDPKMSRSAVLQSVGKKLYGWQRSFGFCTDVTPFRQLDEYVGKQIADYDAVITRRLASADHKTRMSVLGVPSMEDLHAANAK